MQRRWQVQPDPTGIMSREALIEALVDGAAILDIAGGTLSVVVGRAPTNLPGEMVMTGAVLEWRDRTDAKPQPEAPAPIPGQTALDEQLEPAPEPEPEVVQNGAAEPDGFDYGKLEAEDAEEPTPAR
jgi:hypothetical protein